MTRKPYALCLDGKVAFQGLYLNGETETGYIRDRNVVGAPISIEGTMSISVMDALTARGQARSHSSAHGFACIRCSVSLTVFLHRRATAGMVALIR
ncbi:MAG: hypothetical protein U0528_14195 [Anaerolineae bacterium]